MRGKWTYIVVLGCLMTMAAEPAFSLSAADTTRIALAPYVESDTVSASLIVVPRVTYREVTGGTTVRTLLPKSSALMFFYRLGRFIDGFLTKGIDTSYLELNDRAWKLALTNSEVGIHNTMNLTNFSELGNVDMKLYSAPSVALGFEAAYHTIQFNYSWDVLHRRAQRLTFNMITRAWSLEYVRYSNTNLQGYIDAVGTEGKVMVKNGDMEAYSSFLSIYFMFNSDKYSGYNAIRQSFVQKKSAGSFYLQAQYFGSKLTTHSEALLANVNSVYSVDVHQAAVSAGYGYNYTPNRGKFLLHVSAAPMLIVFNRALVSFRYPVKINEKETQNIDLTRILKPQNFYVTGTARVALSWNINEWVFLSGNAQFYNHRLRGEVDDNNMKMSTWNWNANLSIGVRFGVSRKRISAILEEYDRTVAPNKKRDVLDWLEGVMNKH